MNFDIGQVFSNTFKMVQERWLPMIGLWAAFFGALFVYALVFGAVLGGSMMAVMGSMADPGSFDNPAALGGMGIGFILLMIVFYVGYLTIAFGQNASMTAMASPLMRPTFGDAFGLGLKGGLTFLGVIVLLIIAYIIFLLVATLLGFILSFLGEAAPAILVILLVPVVIYLALRFAVLVPVIVVEKVFNPITALNRTWQITKGNVLGIFVVYLVFAIVAMIAVALPFFLLFGSLFDPLSMGAGPGMGTVLFSGLFFLLIVAAFSLFSVSLVASLHAEISDTQAVEFGKTFE